MSGLAVTGRQLEIRYGDQRAVVTEVGATLRGYDVAGRAVAEAFPADVPAPGGQGQVLQPWPNRVADGRWIWAGETQQLALTAPDEGNAIHGLVRYLPWQVVEDDAARVDLETLLPAQPGWPFVLRCLVSYSLGAGGLAVTVTAVNVGSRPCPYGAGAHPYLAVGGRVDDAALELPAATRLQTDRRGIPTGRAPVAGTPYDLRAGPVLGDRILDTAYTDLGRAPDGRVQVRLTGADGARTTLWGDHTVRWLQAFTGDVLPEPWRRRAVAVEPMTCPPDALRSGTDLVRLEPGERHTMAWGLSLD